MIAASRSPGPSALADGDAKNFFQGDVIVGTESSASRLHTSIITTPADAVGDTEIMLAGKELKISADDIQANFDYVPQTDSSLTDKKYVNSRIVTLTQAEYDALGDYDPHVMYCITG